MEKNCSHIARITNDRLPASEISVSVSDYGNADVWVRRADRRSDKGVCIDLNRDQLEWLSRWLVNTLSTIPPKNGGA